MEFILFMVLEVGGFKDIVIVFSERFVLCYYMVESLKGINKCIKNVMRLEVVLFYDNLFY